EGLSKQRQELELVVDPDLGGLNEDVAGQRRGGAAADGDEGSHLRNDDRALDRGRREILVLEFEAPQPVAGPDVSNEAELSFRRERVLDLAERKARSERDAIGDQCG